MNTARELLASRDQRCVVAVDWRGSWDGDHRIPHITYAMSPLIIACDLCGRVLPCYLDVDDNIVRDGEGRIVRQTILCWDKGGCGSARSIIWMPYFQHTGSSATWLGMERK